MPELDAELIERAQRWCASAGRPAGPEEVRAALSRLGWDELVAARAILADPPPARPLGPRALADLARGAEPRQAAEREQAGQYLDEDAAAAPGSRRAPSASGPARPRRPARASVVVRRVRDRAPLVPAPPAALPSLAELERSEGRAVLERLLRRHGARRSAILADLAGGWRRTDGGPPLPSDLDALLDRHGLARVFAARERALLLHALRAAGGVRPRAAGAAGFPPEEWPAALARLGAEAEAEAIREEGRREIRGRATLSQRARMLVADEERLADLGMLDEVLRDLRARMPEHLRAIRSGRPASLAIALGRSLALSRSAVERLAERLPLDLGRPRPEPEAPASRPPRPATPRPAPRRPRRPGF